MSPFQAIIDYEKAHGIPAGWVNYCISRVGRDGAWQRLERGEIPLDKTFYDAWRADLTDEKKWRAYHAQHLRSTDSKHTSSEVAHQVPPPPEVDTEWLHTELMRISRALDPHMGPALRRLRRAADASNGRLLVAALSNTCIFPPGHPLYDPATAAVAGIAHAGLAGIFDVYVSSAHVGMRKPDEDIYKYTLVRLHEHVKMRGGDGVQPSDITFLDDIGQNLRTARQLGMNTIKVTLGSVDLAVKELEKITGLNLCSDPPASKL